MKFFCVFFVLFSVAFGLKVAEIDFEDYEELFETPVKYNLTEIFHFDETKGQIGKKVDDQKVIEDLPNFYDNDLESIEESTQSQKSTTIGPKIEESVKVENNTQKNILTKNDDRFTITLKVDKKSMSPTTIEVKVPTSKGMREKIMSIPDKGMLT